MKKSFFWIGSLLLVIAIIFFGVKKNKKDHQGERLAKVYCASCHVYPEPGLLPKKIWVETVLPEMGLRLGIGDKNTLLSRMSLKLFDQLNEIGIYPNQQLISVEEWESIVAYYRDNSPESKTATIDKRPIVDGKERFELVKILADSGAAVQTTMVRFISEQKQIWVGNGFRALEKYGLEGNFISSFRTPSPVVDLINENDPIYLGIGNIRPNEDRNGRLFTINKEETKGKLLIDSLHRPCQVLKADLDNDGVKDMVILEFGFETGQVRMVNGKSGSSTIISTHPGARNMHIRDGNQDGLPDLYILFAQAREQVSVFHNLGGSKFREEVLLSFPSVYGSSYLEMADMNNDGHEDLIMSFGDNADYSITQKDFHGIQIYSGDGNGKFLKSWFYPSYGATKTIARDFDNDGDQDLAMIGFFSDPSVSNSFMFFENKKGMKFERVDLHVPQEKWLVMESGDMDEDGDLDIILGNFQLGADSNKKETSQNIKALVLLNSYRR